VGPAGSTITTVVIRPATVAVVYVVVAVLMMVIVGFVLYVVSSSAAGGVLVMVHTVVNSLMSVDRMILHHRACKLAVLITQLQSNGSQFRNFLWLRKLMCFFG